MLSIVLIEIGPVRNRSNNYSGSQSKRTEPQCTSFYCPLISSGYLHIQTIYLHLHLPITMSSNTVHRSFPTLLFVLSLCNIIALFAFYVIIIMGGMAFDIYCLSARSPVDLHPSGKVVRPSKPASSSATSASSIPPQLSIPSSSSSPNILVSSPHSPHLPHEPRLQWSISCSDINLDLFQGEIGPRHHLHALCFDAWKENAVISKQLHSAHAEIDELVVENTILSAQIDRLTRDLEFEQVRCHEADSMSQDAAAKLYSQRSTLASLQADKSALRFSIANLAAERDELVADRKEFSAAQKEHEEEVEALQEMLTRTKKELERATRELKKFKKAAAGIPDLRVTSPDGKVTSHSNDSSSADSEDQSIGMKERLTLAYTEVVGLRNECTALRRNADKTAELQGDVKQLLAQRLGLWEQVKAANGACYKLEEENKRYFRQCVEMRAELTRVEKKTGIAISVIQEEEENDDAPPVIVSSVAQVFKSVFEDDSDDDSIASSPSSYSMASTDDFNMSSSSDVNTPHTSVPSSPRSPPLSPSFTMPSWVPCFNDESTVFTFEVESNSPLADAISAYSDIHHPINVCHRTFVTRRGFGIPTVRPSWPAAGFVFHNEAPKRKLSLDQDDTTPKTRRKLEVC